jgi:tetratricopeptide (TPR) repeat protein
MGAMRTWGAWRGIGLLAAASICAWVASPATAQIVQNRLELDGRTLRLEGVESTRLGDLAQVVHSANRAAQDSALEAARAAVRSPDGHYLLAVYQLEIGRQRHDDALRAPALDVLIADRNTPHDRLAGFLGVRGDIAFHGGDMATAASTWGRLLELRPTDPQAMMNLAQVRAAQQNAAGAIQLIRQAAVTFAGGPAPEIWYRQWLSIAFNGHLPAEGLDAGRALIAAYPTNANWRLALVAFRQLAAPQDAAEIDLLRLMRTAGVLVHQDEYQRLAQLLLHSGFPAEAKAVLDEGVSRGIVNGTAAPIPDIRREIDRALQHPQPASLAAATNERFRAAAALAAAGRRTDAEAAFRAVAAGGEARGRWYPDLAGYWLLWLNRTS